LFAAAFQNAHAYENTNLFELAGDPAVVNFEARNGGESLVLKRATQLMVDHFSLSGPYRAIHIDHVGGSVFDMPSFSSSLYLRVSGVIERCELPSAQGFPDFQTWLTIYVASLSVEEARATYYRLEQAAREYREKMDRCAIPLNQDGNCWLRITARGSANRGDDRLFTLAMDPHSCPALNRVSSTGIEMSLKKLGPGVFSLQ
jgi:hypothetical protein